MKNFQNKQKIIKVSRQLRGLARLGLIFWAWMVGLMVSLAIQALAIKGNPAFTYTSFGGLAVVVQALIINWNLLRFFTCLQQGNLFDAKTVGYLQAAGRCWLVYALFDFAYGLVGNSFIGTKMAFTGIGHLFVSLTIIFVAWLLKEAQELQEEQELTV
jgi:hypothetical protein